MKYTLFLLVTSCIALTSCKKSSRVSRNPSIMKANTVIIAVIAALALLPSCRKDESAELKAIREELRKSNARQEDMQRNQRIEREGKALQNQKSYFE